jgi:hypothetical protein
MLHDEVLLLGILIFKVLSTRNIFWGLRRPIRRADNLATFMYQLS